MDILLREGTDEDVGFIYSSWLQSYREINTLKLRTGRRRSDGYPETKDIPTGPALWEHDYYFLHQREILDKVLKDSTVICAVNPEDKDQLYGYVVYRDLSPELRVVSYLYVKHTFRKLGIARKLYESIEPCHIATHGGPSTRKLLIRLKLVFDPFVDIKLIQEKK